MTQEEFKNKFPVGSVVSFEEDKEVTPTELYELLKHNYDKIILV